MDINEVINVVEELNSHYVEVENSSIGLCPYTLKIFNKDSFVIDFMGVRLWFSEEDERDWDEEYDEYEPLRDFLIKESKDIIFVLSSVKL